MSATTKNLASRVDRLERVLASTVELDLSVRVHTEFDDELARAERAIDAMLANMEARCCESKRMEQKYRALYETSLDAIMTLAPPSWGFTSGNPAAIALFGAEDEAQFVLQEPWRLSPRCQPDGQLSSDKAKAMIGSAMVNGSCFFEWTHQKLTGEAFFANVLLTRMELDGQPVLQATVRDITPQREAEQAARQSEDDLLTLHSAVEQSSSTIVITDHEGTIQYANPAFARITGYSLQEALGQNPRVLKSEHHSAAFYKELWETIASGQQWRGQFVNKRKDGTLFWESACISPVLDAQGIITHYVAVKDDISTQKQTEAELQKALSDAERLNRLTVGREMRVVQMKKEVNALLGELGRPARYESVAAGNVDGWDASGGEAAS